MTATIKSWKLLRKKQWVIIGDSENPYFKHRVIQKPNCVSIAQPRMENRLCKYYNTAL